VSGPRLRHVAEVNPSTPEFDALKDEDEVSFVPLERVWPNAFDPSESRQKGSVSTGYTRFRDGDVVVPKITPTFQADRTLIVHGLKGGVGAGTTELHIVRAGPGIETRYVRYLMSTRSFLHGGEAEMIGVAGQKRVPDSWLRDCQVPVMDVDQQRRIADFLDAETARIDALITAKQHQAEAARSRTFTAARFIILGSSNPMDRSPVGADGRRRPKLNRVCSLQRGHDLPADHRVVGPVPVISSGGPSGNHNVAVAAPPGVVTGRYGTVGDVYWSDVPFWPLNTTLYVINFHGNNARWVYWLLRCLPLDAESEKSAVGGINRNVIGELRVERPSLDRQAVIVAELDKLEEWSLELTSVLTRQIELLRERRQALITAAVTGELTV